jgi:signal transduction histidine kinase
MGAALAIHWPRRGEPLLLGGLVLLSVLTFSVEVRTQSLYGLPLGAWVVLPALLGSLTLNTRQEIVLAGVVLGLDALRWLGPQPEPSALLAVLQAGRALVVGLCVWSTWLAEHLRRKREISLKAAALGHEIRQPLTALLVQANLVRHALERQDSHDPTLMEHLEALSSSADQLGHTVTVMTRLLQTHHQSEQQLDLAALLNDLIRHQFCQALQAAAITVRREGLDQALLIAGQPEEIKIVVRNLINNAIESLQQTSQRQRLLLVRVQRAGSRIELTVADSGAGFHTADVSALELQSRKPGGMGLGLFTAKVMLEQMGAKLELARSKELGGAEVLISFPALKPDLLPRRDAAPQHAPVRHH